MREDNEVKVEYIDDSPIFTIDNFYKYPEQVYEYIFDLPYAEGRVGLWKLNQTPSNNGIYFEDRRLNEFDERLFHIYFFFSNLVFSLILSRSKTSSSKVKFLCVTGDFP